MYAVLADIVAHVRRLPGWYPLAIVTLAIVITLAPQQTGLLVFKVVQVAIAIPLAYAADRTLFAHAPRISQAQADVLGAARLIARALVALAVIIGVTLGI